MSRDMKCNLCQTIVPPTSWTQHLVGKKHLRLLTIQKDRKNSDDRTIFVRGFQKGTTELQLSNYFSSFEAVANVSIDKDSGRFAFVQFKEPSSVNRVTSSIHRLDGCLIQVSPRNEKPSKPITEQTEQQTQVANEAFEIDPAIMKHLCQLRSVGEQVHHLMQRMSLEDVDYMQRENLRHTLQALFRQFFVECTLEPYGSSANNLAFKGSSDLDLCLDFGFQPMNDEPSEDYDDNLRYIASNLNDIKNQTKTILQNAIKGLQRKSLVRLVGIIIQKYAIGCVKVFTLPTARCPLVQFFHKNFRLKCDISINNGLGQMNTQLLVVYQQLDSRIRPLIFALRLWSKKAQAAFPSTSRLSSYAISMLVVFYLQNTNPPVLPTVEHLQSLTDVKEEKGGWPCHFCRDMDMISTTSNTNNLEILLRGFFEFYVKVNFGSTVLCLRDGKMLPSVQFAMDNMDRYDVSKFNMSINIQDPFELVHNIAASASPSCASHVLAVILKTHNSLTSTSASSSPSTAFAKSNKDSTSVIPPWGLVAVLDAATNQELKISATKSPKTDVTSSTNTQASNNVKTETGEFQVLLSDDIVYLALKRSKKPADVTDDEREMLVKRLAVKIGDVFSRALRFKCHEVEKSDKPGLPGFKRRNSDNEMMLTSKVQIIQSEEDGSLKKIKTDVCTPLKTFECRVHHRTWMNRKSTRTKLASDLIGGQFSKLIDIEEAISNAIINADNNNGETQPLFIMDVTLHQLEMPLSKKQIGLTVRLAAQTTLNEFKGVLVGFLHSFVQKVVNQTFLQEEK